MRKPGLGGSGMGTSSVNTRPLISGSWRMNSELMLNFCTSVGFAMYIPCPKLENVMVAPTERIENIVKESKGYRNRYYFQIDQRERL